MDTAATLALLLDRVIDRADGRPDHETTSAILNEAARFAECHSDHGLRATPPSGSPVCRTRLRADGHRKAWRALEEAGWLGLTAPEEADGQRLPFASASPYRKCSTRPVQGSACCRSMRAARRDSSIATAMPPCAGRGCRTSRAARGARPFVSRNHRRARTASAPARAPWRTATANGALPATALPFLRLLALASDGLLHQAAARAGPLAGRYSALADFHAVEARREVELPIDRCRHDDLDAAFGAAFAA